MKLHRIVLVILCLVLVNQIKATEQVPDYLIYENDTVSIYSNPLEYNIEVLNKDTSFLMNTCMSTACWRGYQATWEIVRGKLYLLKIEDFCDTTIQANMKLLFEDSWISNRVEVVWYSGELIIPKGKVIYGEHIGYSSVHEFEDIIEIKSGQVIRTQKVDNRKTSLPYLNSEKLVIYLIENLDKRILEEIWRRKLKFDFYVDIEGNEERKVTKIEFKEVRDINYREEIEEVIFKIKDWNILYRHGEKADLPWLYPVKIDKKKLRKKKKYWR